MVPALRASNWILGPVPYLSHLWSIAVEEQFYLLWPLLVFFVSRRGLLYSCIGVCVASLLVRTILIAHGANVETTHRITPARIDSLAFGAIIAIVHRDEVLFERDAVSSPVSTPPSRRRPRRRSHAVTRISMLKASVSRSAWSGFGSR